MMAVCDLKMSDVSTINMVMTVGLAVEAVAHVTRAFMLSKGSPSVRATAAVNGLAQPILNGAFTTILAVTPLLFSGFKYLITYFFFQYLVIIALCLWNGLVMLPVVLVVLASTGLVLKPPASSVKVGLDDCTSVSDPPVAKVE